MSKLNFLKSFYWYDRFALSQMPTSILSFNLPEDLNKWTPNSNSQFTCVSWFTYEQIQKLQNLKLFSFTSYKSPMYYTSRQLHIQS